MRTDDLEPQVSSALHDLVDEPVASSTMFDRVADRVHRRRRRRLTGTAAVVVVVGALATGSLLLRHGGGTNAAEAVTAASCPDKDSELRYDPHSDPASKLVPGKPVIATICRYHGPSQHELAGTLARSAVVRGDSVASLAAALNAGQREIPDAPRTCLGRSEGTIRVMFGYRSGEVVTVRAELFGCRTASNGTTGLITSELAYEQLTDLVGKDPS
jgi:phage tail sheath gpL-like